MSLSPAITQVWKPPFPPVLIVQERHKKAGLWIPLHLWVSCLGVSNVEGLRQQDTEQVYSKGSSQSMEDRPKHPHSAWRVKGLGTRQNRL